MDKINKTLILKSSKTDFERFYNVHMKSNQVDVSSIYRVHTGLLWYIAVIWMEKLHLPGDFFFFAKWKRIISQYDTVILFDRYLNWNVLKYVKKHAPNCRCIIWYWNPIRNAKDEKRWCVPEKYRHLCECWSFDPDNCEKYGYMKNNQFYFEKLDCNSKKMIQYDAFFVGVDKGRYELVEQIYIKVTNCGKRMFMGIVADKNSVLSRKYIKPLDYDIIIEYIQKSNCIVDVVQKNQDGITLRVLEALFFEKKLITTNVGIEQYPFYNSDNILIWNNQTEEDIKAFFNTPYKKIKKEVIHKYTYEGWLNNFGIGV